MCVSAYDLCVRLRFAGSEAPVSAYQARMLLTPTSSGDRGTLCSRRVSMLWMKTTSNTPKVLPLKVARSQVELCPKRPWPGLPPQFQCASKPPTPSRSLPGQSFDLGIPARGEFQKLARRPMKVLFAAILAARLRQQHCQAASTDRQRGGWQRRMPWSQREKCRWRPKGQ